MKRVLFDMSTLTRRQRWKIKWQVRRMGGKAMHSDLTPPSTAVIFDPEALERRLRSDLVQPWRLGITEDE